MTVENTKGFTNYTSKLGEVSGIEIRDFTSLIEALDVRHKFFHSIGCRIADHGILTFWVEPYTNEEIEKITAKILSGYDLTQGEVLKFKSSLLYECARLNFNRGWVQQFHIGPFRNTNTRLFKQEKH